MAPIKGISEVVRLPHLGKIRLGIKKEKADGIPYPSPTDYFACPDEVRKVFGEKPKELRIMFPTEINESSGQVSTSAVTRHGEGSPSGWPI